MPPSPVVMFLFGKKLKQPASPIVPHAAPPSRAPGACAASSITNQPRPLGHGEDRLHVGRIAAVVEHDHGARRRGGEPLQLRRVDREVLQRGRVGQAHVRARLAHAGGGGDERQRGADHLVPGPEAERGGGEVQRRRPVRHRDGVLGADVGARTPARTAPSRGPC